MFFGFTPVLISLEYTVGWKAAVSKVITSDVWQQGHYSFYNVQLMSPHLVYSLLFTIKAQALL